MLRASRRLPSALSTRPSSSNTQHRFPDTIFRAVKSMAQPVSAAVAIFKVLSHHLSSNSVHPCSMVLALRRIEDLSCSFGVVMQICHLSSSVLLFCVLLPECQCETDTVRLTPCTSSHLDQLPAISSFFQVFCPALLPYSPLLYPTNKHQSN
jgi:hypothetical protein